MWTIKIKIEMKKIKINILQTVFLATLMFSAVFCDAQTLKIDSTMKFSIAADHETFYFGWHIINIYDTVRAVLLITECDDCQSKSITAYAIRQKNVYSGDRMPPGNYNDYWSICGYLNNNKFPFAKGTRVWISVIK
jgi:hypothetical protein